MTNKVPVNIRQYESKKSQIQSFTFVYQGGNKWQVIAQSGISEDSPEVKP